MPPLPVRTSGRTPRRQSAPRSAQKAIELKVTERRVSDRIAQRLSSAGEELLFFDLEHPPKVPEEPSSDSISDVEEEDEVDPRESTISEQQQVSPTAFSEATDFTRPIRGVPRTPKSVAKNSTRFRNALVSTIFGPDNDNLDAAPDHVQLAQSSVMGPDNDEITSLRRRLDEFIGVANRTSEAFNVSLADLRNRTTEAFEVYTTRNDARLTKAIEDVTLQQQQQAAKTDTILAAILEHVATSNPTVARPTVAQLPAQGPTIAPVRSLEPQPDFGISPQKIYQPQLDSPSSVQLISETVQIQFVHFSGYYTAAISGKISQSCIDYRAPLAQKIMDHCKYIGDSHRGQYPMFKAVLQIVSSTTKTGNQAVTVVIGKYADVMQRSLLYLAVTDLATAPDDSSTSSIASSVAASFTTATVGDSPTPTRVLLPSQPSGQSLDTLPQALRRVPPIADPLRMPPRTMAPSTTTADTAATESSMPARRASWSFATSATDATSQSSGPNTVHTEPISANPLPFGHGQGTNPPPLAKGHAIGPPWNALLQDTSLRFPILVIDRLQPITIVSSIATVTTGSLQQGSLTTPGSEAELRFRCAESLKAFFFWNTVPAKERPNLHNTIKGILEPLQKLYTASPLNSKDEVLFPSVFHCMTTPWQTWIASMVSYVVRTGNSNPILNAIASNNSLLLSILVYAYEDEQYPRIEYCANYFFTHGPRFPAIADRQNIPGWFQSLKAMFELFLDCAIYRRDDLTSVAFAAPTALAPVFPFRQTTNIEYMQAFCIALPTNAFLIHKLWSNKVFGPPMDSTNNLFLAIDFAGTLIAQFAEARYRDAPSEPESMEIANNVLSFQYKGRTADYRSETTGFHTNNLANFFEFFKKYICRPHGIHLIGSDDPFRQSPRAEAIPKPPAVIQPAAGQQQKPTAKPSYVPADTFNKMSPADKDRLIAERAAAAKPMIGDRRVSEARATSSKSTSNATTTQPFSTTKEPARNPWVPKAEFAAKAPAEQERIRRSVADYNAAKSDSQRNGTPKLRFDERQIARDQRQSTPSRDSSQPYRASALSPSNMSRETKAALGKAYIAQLYKTAAEIRSEQPDTEQFDEFLHQYNMHDADQLDGYMDNGEHPFAQQQQQQWYDDQQDAEALEAQASEYQRALHEQDIAGYSDTDFQDHEDDHMDDLA